MSLKLSTYTNVSKIAVTSYPDLLCKIVNLDSCLALFHTSLQPLWPWECRRNPSEIENNALYEAVQHRSHGYLQTLNDFFLKFNLFLFSFILWIGKLDRTQCTLWLWVTSTQIPWTFARYLLKCANIAKLIPWKQCDICLTSWASTVFHPLLFQVIRRGDRRPFYAPARYVMEVKTDQARLQVGKICCGFVLI